MNSNQSQIPLFHAIQEHVNRQTHSFHVPGHKNGMIFPKVGTEVFNTLLKYDLTEITGLDDLHHPEEAIKDAQELTAELYGVDYSYFLVGGSTVGNLAMILSVCEVGDEVIVQRNSHKSIINALELVGAQPIFISPLFEETTGRNSFISIEQIRKAIVQHPAAKAIILTYPDYFGRTYPLQPIIDLAHKNKIPVLVDEAHGPHFILDDPFPPSALSLGADVVVHSAHKTLPALTMASFLHVNGNLVSNDKIAYYLQVLQSSSPSYLIMASLDLARYYLSQLTKQDLKNIKNSIIRVRSILDSNSLWTVIRSENNIDDPLKITLHIKDAENTKKIMELFERYKLYPELSTVNQVLFIHGLSEFEKVKYLKEVVESIKGQIKITNKHDKIETPIVHLKLLYPLPLSYAEMKKKKVVWVPWSKAKGKIVAETVTPYPPGVPFLLKGEVISEYHIEKILTLIKSGQHIHYQGKDLANGINVLV